MSIRVIASFVLALIFGVVAVLLVRGYVSSAPAPVRSEPVVVAARPIPSGSKIEPSMLKVALYPSDVVPVGAFRTIGQLTGAPHTILHQAGQNEPILGSAVSGGDGKGHLSATLEDGSRAVTIRSSDVAGVGGFALPGDRVDVLATRSGSGAEAGSATVSVLAENVLVLGVDQTSDVLGGTAVVAKAITLEVSPEQAQSVTLAQSIGSITLALRRMGDAHTLSKTVTSAADFAGGPKSAAVVRSARPASARAPRVAPGGQVQVMRGHEASGYVVGGF